jgi:hypothetical protein
VTRRGFAGSPVPIAAWLNPHSTTGRAVEVSKHFNTQPLGMQYMLAVAVAVAGSPDTQDLLYEEELARNPFNLKMWIRYIQARAEASPKRTTSTRCSRCARVTHGGGRPACLPCHGNLLPRPTRTPQLEELDLRWSLWQRSLDVPTNTKSTSGVVGLSVLQPEFLKQFPDARFHFNSGPLAQRGTFKGVWLNEERTEWALERLLQGEE